METGGLDYDKLAPLNPWISKDRGKPLPLAQWNGPGSTRDLSKVDLYELTNPHSAVYAHWRTYLDRIASALEELQDAGVVVLWRPLQEMNGSWFWWGMKKKKKEKEA